MSIEAMALALHHSRSTGTTKLVLVGIANHEGDGGSWPTLATLAKYAGLNGNPDSNSRAVRRAIQALVRLGEVTVHLQRGGTIDCPDWNRPNLYRVTLRCPANCDGSTKHRPVTDESRRDAPVTHRGVTQPPGGGSETYPPGGIEQPPKPSVEPSVESTENRSIAGPARTPTPSASRRRRPKSNDKVSAANLLLLEVAEDRGGLDRVMACLRECHGAKNPLMWVRDKADKGQLEGFLGNQGLGDACWKCGDDAA